MMKFSTNNHSQFELPKVAWMVGCMQLLGGFLSTIDKTIDVIIKFLALSSISKIDAFYAAALPAENKIVKNKGKAIGLMINERHRRNLDKHERPCGIRILSFFTKIVRVFYSSYIFYFIPFTVLLVPYVDNKLTGF